MSRWLVKVRRHTGGESVVHLCDHKYEADALARKWNREYQTDTYYVEEERQ